jgi:hypothetical protein
MAQGEYEFVQLKRTFHELSEGALEHRESDFSHLFAAGNSLGWPELIKEYRLVILSEAGAGKTAEIRNVARELRADGKASFFLRLENVPTDFDDSFEVGSLNTFERWLASGDEGWLLLDSVDEARLHSPGDFELAIRKVGRRLLTALDRTHIIITGRATAWRPKTDLAFCARHLPFRQITREEELSTAGSYDQAEEECFEEAEGSEEVRTQDQPQRKERPAFKIVALDDLDSNQIQSFAKERGIHDNAAFIEAIERSDAWWFTTRPQDLEELTEFWIDQNRIGTRLEIMRNSIGRRLSERDQTRADARPLAAQQARQAARFIAAVSTMTQEPAIRIPDGAANIKGIPIQDVLTDWHEKDQSTLLARPIFDEAIYGTVRFHHRSVREYLTAEWFAHLLSRETSRRKIEALFFKRQYGLEVVVPTMRPILPWLAILDDKIRERVRRVAPEVLLEGGDPSQLPKPTRRFILQEVCEQLARGDSGRSMTEHAAVQRFANLDLTSDIKGLVAKYADNDELKSFLLRMVWLGQLEGALPEAKAIALSPSTSTYTRIAAFRAVKAVGTTEDQEDVRVSFQNEASELNRDWLSELITGIEATPHTLRWLAACLDKTAAKKPHSVDQLSDAVVSFSEDADISLLPELASRLNKLLDRRPVLERRYCEVSEKFLWLMRPAAVAVERLIRARHPAALSRTVFEILHKIPAIRDYGHGELQDASLEFLKLVPEWPELNKSFFWFEVEKVRRRLSEKRGERLTDYWHVSWFQPCWKFDANDFEEITSDIGCKPIHDDKLVALSIAFNLYVGNGRPRTWREKLKASVKHDPELSEQLSKYLRPPAQGKEARAWKRQEARWKRRSEAREKRERERHVDWKEHISKNIELLRDPKLPKPTDISKAQWYLHEQVREKHGNSGRWTGGNWQAVAEDHGEAVALAYRDGLVAYWRRYIPTLQSEGASSNSTPISVIFGLSGLEIEANETPGWPKNLTEAEVELACRYASYELNGFPTWFPKLFDSHANAVASFLLQEIQYELSIETSEKESHDILSDVSWSGEWSWDVLGPAVCTLLKHNEPISLINLRKLLTILQGSQVSDKELGVLAATKVSSVERQRHAAHWFAVWVGVDPDSAIPCLETHIENITSDEQRTSFAMSFVTNICSRRRAEPRQVRQAFTTPHHLKALYLLMNRYIRQRDDINRAGSGVYSPELRDDAQDSRDRLFGLLNEIPGKDAFVALEEISKLHPEQSARPWFVYHARRKAERDADISPWSVAQVRDFNNKLERTPANHRDLADLAILRLLDLKDSLENSDSSIATILKAVSLEPEVRKFVGQELRDKAFGRYAIPQEEELADAKKPDLRFHGISFDAPVPLELKLADNWSGPTLFERLENQLCGDYLRDTRSTRGLFVLIYRGEKAGWDIPDEPNRAEFADLVAALQRHWERISPKFPGVDEVTVIGIDLTKRELAP